MFKGGETGSGDQIQKCMGLMKQAEDWKRQAEGDRWYVEVSWSDAAERNVVGCTRKLTESNFEEDMSLLQPLYRLQVADVYHQCCRFSGTSCGCWWVEFC